LSPKKVRTGRGTENGSAQMEPGGESWGLDIVWKKTEGGKGLGVATKKKWEGGKKSGTFSPGVHG